MKTRGQFLYQVGLGSTAFVLCRNSIGSPVSSWDGVKSIVERLNRRSFPSIFQAWNPADNLPKEKPDVTTGRHDLVFHSPDFWGLHWNHSFAGLADGFTLESISIGRRRRAQMLQRNPNQIHLAEVRYRDAHESYLPQDSPFWKRDDKGQRVVGWAEGGYFLLDFDLSEMQAKVAAQAKAVVDAGLDGIMLDWWGDDTSRLRLIQTVRQAIGKDALIIGNANDQKTPVTAPYINGYFMECWRSKTVEDWRRIQDTLTWAESHLRSPRINCLETWYEKSRQDLNRMRATTALSLTLSDGFCLFSDPNDLPTPDHLHDWYPFWNRSLGRAISKGKIQNGGSIQRDFERGTAVYNPMGNPPVTVHFSQPRRSLATGIISKLHTIPSFDGDLFLGSVK